MTKGSARGPHGLFVIDKPLEASSFDVIRALRRITRIRKLGHAGTLDPLATGVLPVLANRATRLVPYLMGGAKTYQATLQLGITTESGDAEGTVLSRGDVPTFEETEIRHVLDQFVGEISQVPPAYSAIRIDGERAYERARRGEDVEMQPRQVQIHGIDLVARHSTRLEIEVRCGKGTYIRSLARDVGDALGCGAHLAALRRTRVGGIGIARAITLPGLESDTDWASALTTPFDALDGVAETMELPDNREWDVANGRCRFLKDGFVEEGLFRVPQKSTGRLLAVIDARDRAVAPQVKVFLPASEFDPDLDTEQPSF